MFNAEPELLRNYAEEAFKILKSNSFTESDYAEHYAQLGYYGVLLGNLVVGYNLETNRTALYTSSITILEQLANKGTLVGKRNPIETEMETHRQSLGVGSTRIAKTLKTTDTFELVRLDHQYKNGRLILTATRPKNAVTLKNTIFTPYKAVDEAMKCFNNWLNDYVFEITEVHEDSTKKYFITKNEAVLGSVYGVDRAKYLANCKYDSRALSFNAPHLGASVYTSGHKNVDFSYVDSVRVVTNLAEVDMSNVLVDITNSRDFVLSQAEKMDTANLTALCKMFGIGAKDTDEAMLSALSVVSNDLAYEVLCNCGWLNNYKTVPPTWGNATQLDLPVTNEQFADLLKNGAYRVWCRTAKGVPTALIVTNDKEVLKRIYGKDYFGKYESNGVKLNSLKYTLKNKVGGMSTVPLKWIEDRCIEYGLFENVYSIVVNDLKANNVEVTENTQVNVDYLLSTVNKAIYEVDMNKTVVSQVTEVTTRNCCSHSTFDYYRKLSVVGLLGIQKVDYLK